MEIFFACVDGMLVCIVLAVVGCADSAFMESGLVAFVVDEFT